MLVGLLKDNGVSYWAFLKGLLGIICYFWGVWKTNPSLQLWLFRWFLDGLYMVLDGFYMDLDGLLGFSGDFKVTCWEVCCCLGFSKRHEVREIC